jgi:hypothetical protein
MKPSVWVVALAAILSPPARADDAPAAVASTNDAGPPRGFFVEAVLGTSLLGLGWSKNTFNVTGFEYPATVRFGALLANNMEASGSLGLSGSWAPVAGQSYFDAVLGGELKTSWGSLGPFHTYALTGLNAGVLLDTYGTSPEVGLNLGFGGKYFITRHWALGGEVGLRPKVIFAPSSSTFSYGPEFQSGIYLALTGTWLPPPPAPPGQAAAPTPDKSQEQDKPKCLAYVTDGWFEPSQGVWQDDPTVEDRPSKQLSRQDLEGAAYQAELDMVAGKDTLLFGVHHYRHAGTQTTVDSRDSLVLKGYSNCTELTSVKLKVTLREGIVPKELFVTPVSAQVPLDGQAGPKTLSWEVRIPAPRGIPEKPFRFDSPLPYELKAELVRDTGLSTGLFMSVFGRTQVLRGPTVSFVPVQLGVADPSVAAAAQKLALESSRRLPDFLPLPPEGLPAVVKPAFDLSGASLGIKWLEDRKEEAAAAAVMNALNTAAFLEDADRVVGVVSKKDLLTFLASAPPTPTKGRVKPSALKLPHAGTQLSSKVVLVAADEPVETVAHELLHTLPDGWSDDEMVQECGRAYHNREDASANGVRIDTDGAPAARERKSGMTPVMGPGAPPSGSWLSQCTYAHVLKELEGGPPDPPVVLVRAVLLRDGANTKGAILPLYTLWGHTDARIMKPGGYSIVVRDDNGVELNHYGFTPKWTDIETGGQRHVLSVAYRIAWRPDIDTIELTGPSGAVLDRKKFSSKEPTVELESPKDKALVKVSGGKVHVKWRGSGDSDRALAYTVVYSADGGKTFTTLQSESPATEVDFTPAAGVAKHFIRVTVTDGTRSSTVEARVTISGP